MPMPVKITPTEIEDVRVVQTGVARDHRGFFSETYSKEMFAGVGFTETFVQDNLSESRKGTLRGLHYQLEPKGMGKLVRVIRGSVFDVAVDLRRGAPSFGKWVGRTLSAENGLCLWVPVGFAHGFLALADETLVLYKCTAIHAPEAERALNYADPAIGISWPEAATFVTDKDAAAPLLEGAEYNFHYSRS
ncbi:MAG TPA: dTDP-4-dehydrorhamnose 3,5-epimerase [Polyangiaceae bacterium]